MNDNTIKPLTNKQTHAYHLLEAPLVPLTDSHCHLNLINERDPSFKNELLKISHEIDMHILDIGITPSDLVARKKFAENIPNVYFSVGMHPCCSHSYQVNTLITELEPIVQESVAIGEIGLDWYRMYSEKSHQKDLFIVQVQIAKKYKKPIIIHSRESLDDIIEIISSQNFDKTDDNTEGIGIIHCFSGNKSQAKKCLDLGFYISFAGNISYNSAENIREVACYIPSNKILTETDSPYLLHKDMQKLIKKYKKRYNGSNYPIYLYPLLESLAHIRNTSIEDIAQLARLNLSNLLKISF